MRLKLFRHRARGKGGKKGEMLTPRANYSGDEFQRELCLARHERCCRPSRNERKENEVRKQKRDSGRMQEGKDPFCILRMAN